MIIRVVLNYLSMLLCVLAKGHLRAYLYGFFFLSSLSDEIEGQVELEQETETFPKPLPENSCEIEEQPVRDHVSTTEHWRCNRDAAAVALENSRHDEPARQLRP